MKPNVGAMDRKLRLLAGIGLATGGIIFESYWGLIGIVLLITAVLNYCPLYAILGLDTSVNDKDI
jgi:hypothetical protein